MKLFRILAVDQTGINLYEVMYEPRILRCHFILRKKLNSIIITQN